MAFDLTGARVLVTGAGAVNGIGFASAQMLAEMGAAVFLTGASDRVLDRAEELRAAGYSADALACDLTIPSEADRVVAQAVSALGGLDVVINNAGMTSVAAPMEQVGENGTISDMSIEGWSNALSRNLTTAFSVTKAALPHIRKSHAGRIVMVSSVTGPVMAMAGDVAYAASKAGMVGLMRALALDEAAHGVTVNAVAPGWIATDSQTANEVEQGKRTPLGRSARADEIASAVAWLSSREASYITGQVIVVDGGNSIAEERA